MPTKGRHTFLVVGPLRFYPTYPNGLVVPKMINTNLLIFRLTEMMSPIQPPSGYLHNPYHSVSQYFYNVYNVYKIYFVILTKLFLLRIFIIMYLYSIFGSAMGEQKVSDFR